MISIEGKNGIKATVIQDSISPDDIRITTFELEYHRYIHAEFMTHRMFSRNAASSRAIPVEKMHEHIRNSMAIPIHWGANQAGMQAKAEVTCVEEAKSAWKAAAIASISVAKMLCSVLGLHKQISNRVTEPFQMMKVVVTATEWDNFFELRDHSDAQPEIHELAKVMRAALEESCPMPIHYNEWHVPYVDRVRHYQDGDIVYGNGLSLQDARVISASCCAQVSYRKQDDSLEKAKAIYDRLINSDPKHASPVEHQATPLKFSKQFFSNIYEDGVTHIDKYKNAWSANFRGWAQFRHLL